MIWTGLEKQLMRELKKMRDRFHACAVRSGTDKEFADAAVADVDRLLALAEERGGPGDIKL